ncbi:hypothetical protein PV04_07819 [Phialophora macrospora]|uniref:Yippee domain-containing protein n=1 Tax=Phialophora macrospora TaxID=1851006 RepID=A0A0D2DU05_9EURO|nr:hypothetical protein PV04_07819 [Phialophora macrospora]
MGSSSRRMSQPPSSHVNLHCMQCNNQIGIFDNEWSRLTSSYVRPVHPGAHFGTEVAANRTQVVPAGASQRLLEGCTLAEVFCTKCSGVVGQYCKAIPGPERRNMLKQYLYKLSKTYLKSGETNEQVDPIFAYSGDLAEAFTRTSATPRPSLPAVPRWSKTPFQPEETLSRFQAVTDSRRRASAPMSLRNNHEPSSLASGEAEDPPAHRFAMHDAQLNLQEEPLATLDARMRENEKQLRVISSVLDAFRVTLEDINASVKELQYQNATPHVKTSTDIDFIGNLHAMVGALKTAQSNAQELEDLRAENTALKAKWDIVQSAITTAAGSTAPSFSSTASYGNSLGKRKRDSNASKTTSSGPSISASQPRPFWLGNSSSSTQIPTPQSSTHSDPQSHGTSNSSRNATPDDAHDEPDLPRSPQNGKKPTASTAPSLRQPEKKQQVAVPSQLSKNLSPAVRFALGDASFDDSFTGPGASDAEDDEPLSNSVPKPDTSQSSSGQDEQPSTLAGNGMQTAEDEPQPYVDDDTAVRDDGVQLRGISDEPPMGVKPIETTANRFAMGESVEFSGDEEGAALEQPEDQASAEARQSSPANVDKDKQVQARETSTPDDTSIQSAPARRTRSKTQAASTTSTRRKTIESAVISVKDRRSVAPEPPSSRRILPRRISSDQTGRFEHATPETVEAELIELEKPKGPRQCKTHYMQTGTKLLHNELKELGLEEWINKDKNDPEYKQLVQEARERKREQTKLAALARRGVSVPGADMDEALGLSTPSLEEALQQAQALADATTEQIVASGKYPAKTTEPARQAAVDVDPISKRRKSKADRQEKIRKRDELAKAAMEIDD